VAPHLGKFIVSQDVLAGLALSSLSAILLPVIIFMAFRRSQQLAGLSVLAGAAVFIVMVIVLEASMHYYILVANQVTKSMFDSQPWLFAIYAASAAAIFEEGGRYAVLRLMSSRGARPSTPFAYAIGHGGTESILIGINVGTIAIIGYLIMTGQAQSLHLDAATQGKITDMMKGASLESGLMSGVERASAFALQLGFSYLMWSAVTTKRASLALAAVAAHFACDFPAALFQKKILTVTATEFEAAYVLLAILVLAAVWAFAPRAAEAAEPG
jgi:uncharacterized membrane protein YhfC